jgi:glycosyltransferase involved in cell wall biosynthesis
MSQLRFCMVTTFYPPYNFGGDGIAVQHLARALVNRGHRVTVIHDRDAYHALADSGVVEASEQQDGVDVIGLRSRLRVLSPLLTHQTGYPLVHGSALRRELRSGYDVVHFHNASLIGGAGALSFPAQDSVRLYTAHEHWLVCPTNTLWKHQREACDRRECFSCCLSYRRPPQLWRGSDFHERQLSEIDAFIALSEFSRRKHHEMGFTRPMETLPLFLPRLGRSEPGSTDSPHERPYFLYAGRLERIKGLDVVIEASAGYPDADVLIAGDGSDAARLRALANGSPRVHFLGRLGDAALKLHMKHAIALVAPSAGFETFGMVLIEAMRGGTPVIARRMGPLPEIVAASGAGELFDTVHQLYAAMTRLQQDGEHRSRLAANGIAAFDTIWAEDVVVPTYLELVRGLRFRRWQRTASATAAMAAS